MRYPILRYVVGNRQACRTQLFNMTIKPASIEALSNSMEFNCEVRRFVPDLKVFKTPVWSAVADFFALSSLRFAFIFHVLSHNPWYRSLTRQKRKSSLLLPLSPLLFAAVVGAPPRHHSVTYGLPNPERWRMNVVSPSPQ